MYRFVSDQFSNNKIVSLEKELSNIKDFYKNEIEELRKVPKEK